MTKEERMEKNRKLGRAYARSESGNKVQHEYRKRNKDKINKAHTERRKSLSNKMKNAWWTVWNARKSGRLIQEPCVVCGSEKSQAHHEDYDKQLEVIWLCRKHHAEKHRK